MHKIKNKNLKTRNWIQINNKSRGAYDANNEIKCKTLMIRSRLCDYNDVYVHVERTITISNMAVIGAAANNANKKVIFLVAGTATNQVSAFTKTDTKHYVPVVTLST